MEPTTGGAIASAAESVRSERNRVRAGAVVARSRTYSPAAAMLSTLCEPLLRPVRRVIPQFAGIDLSALFVIIALQALVILIT